MVIRRLRRAEVFAGIGIAVIALADDAAYIALIAGQHGPYDSRTYFVAALLAVVAGAAVTATIVTSARVRALLLSGVASVAIGLGIVGIFSIGAPLLVAGAIAVFAATRITPMSPPLLYAAGAAAGLVVVIAGFLLTSLDLPR